MIQLEHVDRVFLVGETSVHALRDLTVSIAEGAYVSVMGPSGSGKSTLLNIIGCLDRPSSGKYRLGGVDVGALPEQELSQIRGHKIGFVFQTFHLVPRLTSQENVELPLLFAGVDRAERVQRAAESLAGVGLTERARHRPDQLSGGERQRVAIARAVVMRPAILLADEPTGNLDRTSGREVLALLERLNTGGLTLIVVTHDPAVGERARRRLRLADGALVSDAEATSAEAESRNARPPLGHEASA